MMTRPSIRHLATALHTPQTTETLLEALRAMLLELGCQSTYTLVFAAPQVETAEVWDSTYPNLPVDKVFTINPNTLGNSLYRNAPIYFSEPLSVAQNDVEVSAAGILPLRADGDVYGALLLHDRVAPDIHDDLEFLVDQLGLALLHVQLNEERQRRHAQDAAVVQAITETGEVLRALDLDVVLSKLMAVALSTVGAEVGCIAVRRTEDNELTYAAGRRTEDNELTYAVVWGLDEALLDTLRFTTGKTLTETVVQENTSFIVYDMSDKSQFAPASILESIDSLAAFPLATHDRVIGCLLVLNLTASDSALDLLRSIIEMASTAIENAMLHEQTLEQEALKEQLRIAGTIQQRLLPVSPPIMPGLQIAARNLPCDAAGGDYYDFFPLDKQRLGFVVGDATGHGIGAALLATTVRAFLRALVEPTEDLGQLFARVNELATADFATDKFITLVFGIYDTQGRTLTYASAGHDPPLLIYRHHADVFESLDNTGPPLGAFSGATYTQETIGPLEPRDLLLLLTDGIHEAPAAHGESFGKARLLEVIREQRDAKPENLIDRLCTAVRDFCGSTPQNDDITLLCLRVLENESLD